MPRQIRRMKNEEDRLPPQAPKEQETLAAGQGGSELPIDFFQQDELTPGAPPPPLRQQDGEQKLPPRPPVPPDWRERFNAGAAMVESYSTELTKKSDGGMDDPEPCWERRYYVRYRMGIESRCTIHTHVFIVQPYASGAYQATAPGSGGQTPIYHYKVVEYSVGFQENWEFFVVTTSIKQTGKCPPLPPDEQGRNIVAHGWSLAGVNRNAICNSRVVADGFTQATWAKLTARTLAENGGGVRVYPPLNLEDR